MIDLDSQSCLLRVTSKPPFQSNSSLLCFPGLPAAARHSRLRASSELHLSCARSPTLEGMSGLRSPDQHHRSRLIPIQSLSLSPLFLSLSLSFCFLCLRLCLPCIFVTTTTPLASSDPLCLSGFPQISECQRTKRVRPLSLSITKPPSHTTGTPRSASFPEPSESNLYTMRLTD